MITNENLNKIIKYDIFDNIALEDMKSLISCIGMYEKKYSKGETIFLTGQEFTDIGLIYDGVVYMVMEDYWGNKSIFSIMREGEIFGESYVCSSSTSNSISFIASTECNVLLIPFSRILRTCKTSCKFHHELIENMVKLIAYKNTQFIDKLDIMSKKTIREKIMTYLSQQVKEKKSNSIISPMGRTELAEYLGINRSSLTRELKNMKKENIIDFDKNYFRIIY